MTNAPLPNMLDLTPLNEAYRTDPHRVLDDLRARCPVHHDPMGGSFVLTRYADVRGVVSDRTLWRDPLRADPQSNMMKMQLRDLDRSLPRGETTSILHLDDPDHQRIRGPLVQAFYARVAKFRPAFEAIVEATLDRIDATAPFDLMATFCVPIPIDAIASILGVDPERLPEFREWSEAVIHGLNPFRTEAQTAEMERCGEKLTAYFLQTIAARRASPCDDLISDMTTLQAAGAEINDTELRINLGALLVGGNLTTTDLIGNAVRLLLLHPAELETLRAEPGLINSVVEETLRYEGPVDITGRIASHAMEVGGCPMKASDPLTLSLRAANRDPEAFDEPHVFRIGVKRAPHVAFGGGAHICIGAPLARLEAQVALLKLFERFPDLKLAGADAPEWRRLPFFRGLERLVVAAA